MSYLGSELSSWCGGGSWLRLQMSAVMASLSRSRVGCNGTTFGLQRSLSGTKLSLDLNWAYVTDLPLSMFCTIGVPVWVGHCPQRPCLQECAGGGEQGPEDLWLWFGPREWYLHQDHRWETPSSLDGHRVHHWEGVYHKEWRVSDSRLLTCCGYFDVLVVSIRWMKSA